MSIDEKIRNFLIDGLTVEDLQLLLSEKQEKIADKEPRLMTETEKWTKHYQDQIVKFGVLFPPKQKKATL